MPLLAEPVANSFLWHDYETFGTDTRTDRPAEIALWRTNEQFEPVADPLLLRCRPPLDFLPDPGACRVTGIGPEAAYASGLAEPEFAAAVHAEMAQPGTCTLGYNSLRFDDEVTRHLYWRNFLDPYEREWRNGNSRFDLIDLARACYALRPDGLQWPMHEAGRPSFRLEELSKINALPHQHAHSALSDVEATIALARKLRAAQPKLFAWALELRRKQRVLDLLDWRQRTPMVHVSQRFAAERGCLAVVLPMAPHPSQGNKVIVIDCQIDPTPVLEWPPEQLAQMLLTPASEPDRVPLGIKLVHANRSPFVAPLNVLKGVDHARIGLDLVQSLANAERLRAASALDQKLQQMYALLESPREESVDAERALYAGFVGDGDRALCRRVPDLPPSELRAVFERMRDPRLRELGHRYRARHHPGTLNAAESAAWLEHCRAALQRPERNLSTVLAASQAMAEELPALAEDLVGWCRRVAEHAGLALRLG